MSTLLAEDVVTDAQRERGYARDAEGDERAIARLFRRAHAGDDAARSALIATVRSTSVGSRPTLAHHASSTSLLRFHSAGGRYGAFQPSAKRAAVRRVRFSPAPPIQSGRRF